MKAIKCLLLVTSIITISNSKYAYAGPEDDIDPLKERNLENPPELLKKPPLKRATSEQTPQSPKARHETDQSKHVPDELEHYSDPNFRGNRSNPFLEDGIIESHVSEEAVPKPHLTRAVSAAYAVQRGERSYHSAAYKFLFPNTNNLIEDANRIRNIPSTMKQKLDSALQSVRELRDVYNQNLTRNILRNDLEITAAKKNLEIQSITEKTGKLQRELDSLERSKLNTERSIHIANRQGDANKVEELRALQLKYQKQINQLNAEKSSNKIKVTAAYEEIRQKEQAVAKAEMKMGELWRQHVKNAEVHLTKLSEEHLEKLAKKLMPGDIPLKVAKDLIGRIARKGGAAIARVLPIAGTALALAGPAKAAYKEYKKTIGTIPKESLTKKQIAGALARAATAGLQEAGKEQVEFSNHVEKIVTSPQILRHAAYSLNEDANINLGEVADHILDKPSNHVSLTDRAVATANEIVESARTRAANGERVNHHEDATATAGDFSPIAEAADTERSPLADFFEKRMNDDDSKTPAVATGPDDFVNYWDSELCGECGKSNAANEPVTRNFFTAIWDVITFRSVAAPSPNPSDDTSTNEEWGQAALQSSDTAADYLAGKKSASNDSYSSSASSYFDTIEPMEDFTGHSFSHSRPRHSAPRHSPPRTRFRIPKIRMNTSETPPPMRGYGPTDF